MELKSIVASVFKALEDRGVDLVDFGGRTVDEIARSIELAQDVDTLRAAASLIDCNCSYDANIAPEDRCDGTCTHSELLALAKKLERCSTS